jgi:hypothetical protein
VTDLAQHGCLKLHPDYGWPAWTWEESGVEPEVAVWIWQGLVAKYAAPSFPRPGTGATGVGVGLALSTWVTISADRETFAETFVGQDRLAAHLRMKRQRLGLYLREGAAAGWWVIEDRGRAKTKLITLSTPNFPWWIGHNSAPQRERGGDGRFVKSSSDGPVAGPSDNESSVPSMVLSEGHHDGPARGDSGGPARGEPWSSDRTTTYVETSVEEPTENTYASTNGEKQVWIRFVDGPNKGQRLSVAADTAEGLIGDGEAVAA